MTIRRNLVFPLMVVSVVIVTVLAVVVATKRVAHEPNVLIIMVDDATYEEIRVMRNVNERLAAEGTSFSHYYTSTPNCCPSRGGYYTGRYPHNTGIKDNLPPLGGAVSFIPYERDSLGPWMQQAGYYTAHVGKFLNGWGDSAKPDLWKNGTGPLPGWDHWFGLIDPTTYNYFDYKVNDDGTERSYGKKPDDYQTDVLGRDVLNTIDKGNASGKPWFISFTPLAPHVGRSENSLASGTPDGLLAVPAPRHNGMFKSEPLPKSPSIMVGGQAAITLDVKGKPPIVRERVDRAAPFMSTSKQAYQRELEALLSVDEVIGSIYQKLSDQGQLDNTVIMFTSDNGLFHGEHGLYQKGLVYEEAVHLPLIIRGPGFPEGVTASQMAVNVDLAPTTLKLARSSTTAPLDGRDLQPVANDPNVSKDRAILLEQWYTGSKLTTRGVRVDNWSYFEWSDGEKELYDFRADPFQRVNIAKDPANAAKVSTLLSRLRALQSCSGRSCEDSDLSRNS